MTAGAGGGSEEEPRLDDLDAPEAAREHYRSVDSTPQQFAENRPLGVVNGFLVSFVAVGLLVLLAITALIRLGYLQDSRDIVLFPAPGRRAAVPVRVFILVFFGVFSMYLPTNVWRRLLVLVELCGGFLLICLAVDLAALVTDHVPGATPPVAVQQIAAAMFGLGLFPWVVLRNARLPEPGPAPSPTARIGLSAWARLLIPLGISGAVAIWAAHSLGPVVEVMQQFALLGGVGPGVFLVQQVVVLITGCIGLVMIARSRRGQFAPSIGVVIPAHNEAHDIAETIGALDRAAGAYTGAVRLFVVDNVSTDDTAGAAERAMDRASHLTCSMLSCPTPGKARALNYGLNRLPDAFVVRIDADVSLGEDCLGLLMRHFADARVGAVGGLPLPERRDTFIDRVRMVEVLLRHGLFQLARVGYDGVVGVPGMVTAYRRSALDEAGPIQEGMNGEDTDICMRLNSLGYRSLAEPRAVYTTEVPRTWAHLTEQRIRWFRSIYHIAAHNRRALLRPGSMAGAVVLPFAMWNAARRAMLIPVLLFAVVTLGVFWGTFRGLHWQPVLAMGIGMPALFAVAVCLLQRQPRAVLYVPEYLVFRLIRSYFTLAAVLSLRFPPLESPWKRSRRSTSARP